MVLELKLGAKLGKGSIMSLTLVLSRVKELIFCSSEFRGRQASQASGKSQPNSHPFRREGK
jgi:hypothetical protein